MLWRTFMLSVLCIFRDAKSIRAGRGDPTRLLCSAVPPGEDPVCSAPSPHGAFTHDTTVIRLRETVLLQKETILTQRDTMHELRSELGRCEVVRDKARQETGNAMEDRPPNRSAEILDELGRTMRLLKHRLESLEVTVCTSFIFFLVCFFKCYVDGGAPFL